jgi:hypothetical protein
MKYTVDRSRLWRSDKLTHPCSDKLTPHNPVESGRVIREELHHPN